MWLRASPLRLFINGHGSVVLFFVLSGYVLSMPFLRNVPIAYRAYLSKRICRIYIPFAFAVGLSAVLYMYSSPLPPGASSLWQHNEWRSEKLSTGTVASHLLMSGVASDMWLNGVMWSLVVEMRISVLFPLLMLLCLKSSHSALCAVAIYVVCTVALMKTDTSFLASDSIMGSLVVTLRFIPMFIFGILLSKHHRSLANFCDAQSWLWRGTLVAFAVCVFYLPADTSCGSLYGQSNDGGLLEAKCFYKGGIDVLIAMASGILVVLARGARSKSTVLNAAVITFLGRISYSLYLTHLPVIFFVFRSMWGMVDSPLIHLTAFVACIGIAWLFHVLIERPSIIVAKRL